MSVGLPSDEVAEDYKNSLEDLTMNSRYEISNLTVIAKENTVHAETISRVLENHIRNTLPHRKLPALYVLDSIVKNVGTPYTSILGHNLYRTFMDAYSLVDNQVRKKLDEMLKTWKEPVPGSLDLRPVFPVETTRPIENALIKARTLAVQQQQQQQQSRSQQDLLGRNRLPPPTLTAWRNTPTPPQSNGRQSVPGAQGYPPPMLPNGNMQQIRPAYPLYQTYSHLQQPPSSFPLDFQPSAPNLGTLHQDIETLITAARNEVAALPWDRAVKERLDTLTNLQSIVLNQQLSLEEIYRIQTQVAQLLNVQKISTPAQAPSAAPALIPNLQALFSSDAVANLLASAGKDQQAHATPSLQYQPSSNPLPLLHSIVAPPSVSAGEQNPLIAKLRAAGMLLPDSNSSTNGPINSASTPSVYTPPPASVYPPLAPSVYPPVPSFVYQPPPAILHTPPVTSMNLPLKGVEQRNNDVLLTSASLKIPRPHLISSIYEAQPNQCSICGRRFLTTEEGRAKKARHMDWHFNTNRPLANPSRPVQSRCWYVDEMAWIKSRDNNEKESSGSLNDLEASEAREAAIAAEKDPKNKFIPAPNDPILADAPCPICHEKFKPSWNEEMQDFLWMDAIKIGSKIYHSTCYAAMKKDGANTPLRTPTPESVLGKRKPGMNEINLLRSKLSKNIKAS